MTNTEKWNLIVENYKLHYSDLESKIQLEWEMYCTELFGYKKLLNEIDSQRHLSIGSGNSIIPDIILQIDKKDIFDIELKQYSLSFNETFEKQLISYLNQTHLSVGMIVCNKIYLYSYEYASISINKIEIPFEKDNQDGIALVEMLSKDNFSPEKIKKYINEKNTYNKLLLDAKQCLTNEWIKETVKTELLKNFSEIIVSEVLKDISFKVISKIPCSPTPSFPVKSPVLPYNFDTNITSLIHNWCVEKSNSGEINFPTNHSNKKYTRFTTPDLDKLIPYQEGVKSGWNTGYFYSYEIIDYNGKIKMWIAFSNVNTPDSIRQVYEKFIPLISNKPRKNDWQWWSIFSTKTFDYIGKTPAEIFNELNYQFAEIQNKLSVLLNNFN